MAKPKSCGKAPEARIRARNEAKILKAAVALFATKGFDGTRMGEVAERSGLPRANVYYYFPTKKRMYNAAIESVLDGWDRAFEHIEASREPRQAISDYVVAKLEYSRKHSAESRFFANEVLSGAKFLRRHNRHMQEVTRQRSAVVEQWIEKGKIATVDPHHFFIMLWSATQFYADFAYLASRVLDKRKLTSKDYEAAAETIVKVVLDGCSTGTEKNPGMDDGHLDCLGKR